MLKEAHRMDNGRLDILIYFNTCDSDARQMIGNKKQMGKGATNEFNGQPSLQGAEIYLLPPRLRRQLPV
jgi:hypothetical protein